VKPTVLMYHSVGERRATALDREWVLPPRDLERHLRWLGRLRIPVVPLERVLDELPRRAVILTFDDAFSDFATEAWPILQRHGCPAAVMVPTAHVGGANEWDAGAGEAPRRLLGWDELRALAAAGVAIEAHGHRHCDLRTLSAPALESELAACVACFERELGRRPRYLAYPFNHTSGEIEAAVERTGFRAALGGHWARGGPFSLRRQDTSAAGQLAFLARALGWRNAAAAAKRRLLDVGRGRLGEARS